MQRRKNGLKRNTEAEKARPPTTTRRSVVRPPWLEPQSFARTNRVPRERVNDSPGGAQASGAEGSGAAKEEVSPFFATDMLSLGRRKSSGLYQVR